MRARCFPQRMSCILSLGTRKVKIDVVDLRTGDTDQDIGKRDRKRIRVGDRESQGRRIQPRRLDRGRNDLQRELAKLQDKYISWIIIEERWKKKEECLVQNIGS